MNNRPITFILGCTGSGKGAFGREIARRTNAEIVSLDSMKVYRRMDIGTAKPSAAARREIPHHLIDVVEPSDEFSVARYVELAEAAIADIQSRNRPVLVVGGTPMYLKALTEGLFEGPSADPILRDRLIAESRDIGTPGLHARLVAVDAAAADRIHPNDLRRIVRALEVFELTGRTITAHQEQWDKGSTRFEHTLIGLRRDPEDQAHRTNTRVKKMIDAGLVEEVVTLLAEPAALSETARKAVGYAEIIEHLAGRATLEEAVEQIKINTRRFAKSQRTWFRRFHEIQWIDLKPDDTADAIADSILRAAGIENV
jgi:tRNA dimethylallyltransferase